MSSISSRETRALLSVIVEINQLYEQDVSLLLLTCTVRSELLKTSENHVVFKTKMSVFSKVFATEQ